MQYINTFLIGKFPGPAGYFRLAFATSALGRHFLSQNCNIDTGNLLILNRIFLFKFNAGNPHETYARGADQVVVKDLYKTVVTVFKGPGFTIFTVVAMTAAALRFSKRLD